MGEWWCPRFCLISRACCSRYPQGQQRGRGGKGGKRELPAGRAAQPGPPGWLSRSRQPAMTQRRVLRQYRADPLENIDWGVIKKNLPICLERSIYFRKKVSLQTGELQPGREAGCLMTKKTKLVHEF